MIVDSGICAVELQDTESKSTDAIGTRVLILRKKKKRYTNVGEETVRKNAIVWIWFGATRIVQEQYIYHIAGLDF